MNKFLRGAACAALSLILAACAGAGATSAGATIALLGEVQASIDETLNSANFAFNNGVNNSAVQLETLVAQLREAVGATTSDVDRRITAQQERALEGILTLRDSIDASIEKGATEVRAIEGIAAQILSDLPLTSNQPRVTKVSVPPFVRDWTQSMRVVLEGHNLDDAKNSLMVSGSRVDPTLRTATKLEFTIPAGLLTDEADSQGRLKIVRASVALVYPKGLFRGIDTASVTLPIRVVPRIIGSAVIVYRAAVPRSRTHEETSNICAIGTRGTPASGRRREGKISCRITAPTVPVGCEGRSQQGIIVGKPRIEVLANRHGGGHGISAQGPNSFVLDVSAMSRGRPGGGGGLYAARAHYTVEYPCLVPTDLSSPTIPLKLGSEEAFALPGTGSPQVLWTDVTLFDSTKAMLTGPRGAMSLVSVEQNSNRVVIRPIRVDRN